MKKIVLIMITAMLFILSACTSNILGTSFNAYKGTGEIETKTYELSDFDEIGVSGGMDLTLIKSDDYGVSIETNSDIFEKLDVKTSDGKLIVNSKEGLGFYNTKIKVIVKCPTLNFIELSNAISANIEGDYNFDGDVHIELSNASSLKGNISGDNLFLDLANASEVELEGEYKKIIVEAANASQADLRNVKANTAKINLSNTSECDLDVTGDIEVDASNSSELNVYGGKVVEEDLSNLSEVNYK